jgi:hypothetical protein
MSPDAQQIQKSASATQPACVEMVKDLQGSMNEMREKDHYNRVGQKNMMMQYDCRFALFVLLLSF